MNMIKKLYNGEYGLPMTFWVFGILVSSTILLLGPALVSSIGGTINTIYTAKTLSYGLALFALFAIWNAANSYTGDKTTAHLARFSVLLGIGLLGTSLLIFLKSLGI